MEKQCGVGPEKGRIWREASREVTLMDQESYISVMDPGIGIRMVVDDTSVYILMSTIGKCFVTDKTHANISI